VSRTAADQPLDREDRVLGVGDGLALGDLADEPLTASVMATIDGVVRLPSELG
jgi:hypothetical protein